MEERAACALLKQRFEAAGFMIEENRAFEEDGIRFEIDGFDAKHRVGYEYVTSEAGDSWDVDDSVIAALADRRKRGELHVLVVAETEAPDAEALGTAVDRFLTELREQGVTATLAGEPPPAKAAPPAGSTGEPEPAVPMPIIVPEEPNVGAAAEPPEPVVQTSADEAPVAAAGGPRAAAPMPVVVPEEPPVVAETEPPAEIDPRHAADEPAPAKAKTGKPKSPRAKAVPTRPKTTRKKPTRK